MKGTVIKAKNGSLSVMWDDNTSGRPVTVAPQGPTKEFWPVWVLPADECRRRLTEEDIPQSSYLHSAEEVIARRRLVDHARMEAQDADAMSYAASTGGRRRLVVDFPEGSRVCLREPLLILNCSNNCVDGKTKDKSFGSARDDKWQTCEKCEGTGNFTKFGKLGSSDSLALIPMGSKGTVVRVGRCSMLQCRVKNPQFGRKTNSQKCDICSKKWLQKGVFNESRSTKLFVRWDDTVFNGNNANCYKGTNYHGLVPVCINLKAYTLQNCPLSYDC